MQLPQPNEHPNLSTSPEIDQTFQVDNKNNYYESGELTEASRENFLSKPVFDPLFLFDLQAGVDPIRYNLNLLTQYQQTLRLFGKVS